MPLSNGPRTSEAAPAGWVVCRPWSLARWAASGSVAVADQGLFAGSHFLLNVLLARWLEPSEYGTFALAYSGFLLLATLHGAILTEPMLVFGPGKYRDRFPAYLGILLIGHVVLALLGGAVLAGTALLLGRLYSAEMERAFLALALVGPGVLLLWFLRRAFYVRLAPGWPLVGGAVYLLMLVACVVVLRLTGTLSPAKSFLAMGAAGLIASVPFFVLLRPRIAVDPSMMRTIAADHWRYGRWAAASVAPSWVSGNVYFVVLSASKGLAEAGAFKALLNLAMPAQHGVAALAGLLLPSLATSRSRGGFPAMSRTIRVSLALFLLGTTSYGTVLWLVRDQAFRLLYEGKYLEYASWPLVLALSGPLLASVQSVLANSLRALEKPQQVFHACVWGAGVALALAIPLVRLSGLIGAMSAFLVSTAATAHFLNRALVRSCTTRCGAESTHR